VRGEYEGQGVLEMANGSRYEGEFKQGKMNGKGTFFDEKGKKY